ncbi:MAG: DUF1549 domain-containing protein [Phycisphaera sp.]|nr:DUF1549 domain-containing protein [Phycisphaera sp.]
MKDHSRLTPRWIATLFAAALVATGVAHAKDPGKSAAAAAESTRSVAAAAEKIDQLLAADWQRNNVKPNPPATDEQFVRRIYLDVAGRIPSYDEITRFLDSKESNKRAKLIDQLLASEGYVSNFYNYWADVLRVKTRMPGGRTGMPYEDWIKESLRTDKHYDDFVREMITAEGSMYDNGATGYYIRDSGMPLDNLSNTVRIFLGTQIGCAQCHDHPFDKWTQYEFYQMAAFTNGVRTRQKPSEKFDPRKFRDELAKSDLDNRGKQFLLNLTRTNSYGVAENAYLSTKLPDNYKYDDAKPSSVVKPATIFGKNVTVKRGDSLREAFADWMTAKDNPRFAMVIANRLWDRAFGVGVLPSVDDIRDETVAVNPELMTYLTGLIKDYDFDMKAYLRVVFNTQAYQREASPTEIREGEVYRFPGPLLRRMSAAQVWDSVLTLVMPDPDDRHQVLKAGAYGLAQIDISDKTTEELFAMARDISKRDPREMRRKMMMEAMRDNAPDPKYRGYSFDMMRASELESPARPGHFLREFGQSDRELIDGSNDDPAVTQVLTLMNGPVDELLLGSRSMLRQNMESAASPEQRVRIAFLSILGRNPSGTDIRMADKQIEQNGKTAYTDLVWALVNTREFLFVQ